jgi:uncharacterized caspase-like protein
LTLAVTCGTTTAALADKRVALLIGNAHYAAAAALRNPGNDVAALADALEGAGFDAVLTANDLGRDAMVRALRSFEDQASGADIAVIYYSGHGLEMDGTNYLIPVDAKMVSDRDVEDETISLDRALRSIEGARRLKLVILDACRNDPFLARMSRRDGTRALTRGLGRIEPRTVDTLVAYSAKAGTLASDGTDANSPFTASLVRRLVEPGVDIRIALGKVRDDVLAITHREQEPFVYGSLGGDQLALSKVDPSRPGSDASTGAEDARAFEAAKRVGTIGAYEAFIATYPGSFYAKLAKELRLSLLPPVPEPSPGKLASPPPVVRPATKVPPVQRPPSATPRPPRASRQAGRTGRQPLLPKVRPKPSVRSGNCFTFSGQGFCE